MAKAEKRAVHMKGIRSRILKTAENLFLEQGYKTTTIRQIVQDSGITSGSIIIYMKTRNTSLQH